MKPKIMLMAVLLAILAVSVNASVVYEGFDYTEGELITGQGTATDGWAGGWTVTGSNYHEIKGGLNLAGVQVFGGSPQRPSRSGNSTMNRQISAAAQAALTADNTTVWFSVLMFPGDDDPIAYPVNSYGTFIFGDAELTGGAGWNASPIAEGGNAIGVSYVGGSGGTVGLWENMQIQGVVYQDGTLTENAEQRTTVGASTVMIVGKIDWDPNGTDDVVSLYLIEDPSVTLPEEPFSTMSVDLNQTSFNVVAIGDAQRSIFDEIRFGTSYEEVAPLVDAGADMVSWSGAAVQLASTDTLDLGLTLSYNWTADLKAGITADFSPSATDPAPTVTFTKTGYANAVITNTSFEDPALSDGGSTANNNVPGWVAKNAWVWNIPDTLYGGIAPDGENVVRVNNTYDGTDKYVYQVVDETIQAGATYTLNVSLGVDYVTGTADPNSTDPNSTVYKVELLAGSDYDNAQVLAGEVGTYSDTNDYKEVSVAYTYNEATDAALIGQPLQIRLTCVYGTSGSERGAIFDNVELTSSPDFPAPSVATAGLTLTVDDGVNPPVSDSMTVDIYDDACTTTLVGLNVAGAKTDLSGDCITNLEDLADLARNWMIEIAVDTPQVKP